ncbi:MAG: DNA translocase FtsK [Rhizobiaceae bacterium]|nr:DNA translocase FtsK [Rhizobiaceae bacterium]
MRSGAASHLEPSPAWQGLGLFLRKQVGRLAGLAIFAGIGFALASLATWNVADPSFSHATDNPVTNAMGFPGAAFSDLAIQFYGLSAVAALAPAAIWAIFFLSGHYIDRKPRRAVFWFAASILFAAIAGCVTPPDTWPLPTGLGGVFGDMVLKVPAVFNGGYPTGLLAMILAGAFTIPALGFAAYGAGLVLRRPPREPLQRQAHANEAGPGDELAFDEDDHEGEGSAVLGAIAHWWLSAQAFLRRRSGGRKRYDDGLDLPAAAPGWRQAAERVEIAERQEARVRPVSRARVEPEFFAAMVADGRTRQVPPAAVAPPEPELFGAPQPEVSEDEGGLLFAPSFEQDGPGTDAPGMDIVGTDAPEMDDAGFASVEAPAPQRSSAPKGTPTHVQAFRSPSGRVKAPAPRPEPAAAAPAARVVPAAPGSHDVFEMPSLGFLAEPKNVSKDPGLSRDALEQNARILEGVLDDFGVKGEIINVRPGPVVTLYELEPAPGIKSSRVIGLADDIARSMSAIACRVAVVPGRNAIGIELPNAKRETVYLRELLASRDFETTKANLALALGKTINGEAVIVDIAKMPHVLVAGTTGSGKSVAINTMILSLLYRMTPAQCRLIMVDPKMVELSVYDGIPHLLTPVVTDPKKAVVALKWTVREMEDRYRKMAKLGVRNAEGFNARVAQAAAAGESIKRTVQTGFDRETGEAIYESEELDLQPLPFIVVIIDEVADLMMVAGKDIEGAVQRLGQMARAAGIHVIMATQRPSVDVITGTIKANFPTRMSFQVTSKIDSRTILGEQGAEQLLGMGDMLYMAGGGRIQRVHGPFVADSEVERVVAHLKLQGAPEYLDAITQDEDEEDEESSGKGGSGNGSGGGSFDDSDDPYDQAVAVVLSDGKASTSYIQRRLGIGYNRAASIIEKMEKEGIVGPANHAGKREILVPTERDKM